MKITTFMAGLAMLMQSACAQVGGSSGGGGSSPTPRAVSQPAATVGGGGFGSDDNVARIRTILTDGNPTAESLYILNAADVARPKEKGPYLGVGVTAVPAVVRDQLKLQKGVGLVATYIEKESPAAGADVRENDILTKLDDQVLVNPQQLAVLVRIHKLDDPVRLTVIREAKPIELTAKLTERELAALDESSSSSRQRLFDSYVRAASPVPFKPDPFGVASYQVESSDDQNSFTVTRRDGHATVLATDKDGKAIFEGPIDTDEQVEKVPKEIRDKVKKLRSWPAKLTTTRPFPNLKILPPAAPTPRRSPGADPTY
jgi:hypothetical protein